MLITDTQSQSATPPVVDGPTDKRRVTVTRLRLAHLGRYVLLVLLLWVCYRYLLGLSLTYFPESDNASPLLAAQDMLHGNWALRGWWMSTDSFWLTDKPLYVVGVALKGLTPALMDELPTGTYVALLVLAAVAVLSPQAGTVQPQSTGIAITAALLPLLFPSYVLGRFVLKGDYHIAVTEFVLGSFLMMHYALLSNPTPRPTRLLAAAAGLLAAALVSDPLALWIGIAPAILTSFVLMYQDPRLRGPALIPASVAIAGWLAAKTILGILHIIGGFTRVAGERAAFVDFSGLGGNIALFVQGILDLFGANFFGLPASLGTLPVLLRLCGCLTVIASIGFTLRHIREQDDRLSLFLAMGTVVIAAAFVFSAVSRPLPSSIGGTRYLVPLVIFGSIFLGRRARTLRIPTAGRQRLILTAFVLAIAGLYTLAPVTRLRHPTPAVGKFVTGANDWPSIEALGAWLAAHDLHSGYGPFSAASIVTVATGGTVVVRPVGADHPWLRPYDEIRPLEWYSKCSWYHDPAARFVVARDDWDNVNLRTVRFTFGPPAAIYTVAGFTIFEWAHPIQVKSTVTSSSARYRIVQAFVKIMPIFRFAQNFAADPCT